MHGNITQRGSALGALLYYLQADSCTDYPVTVHIASVTDVIYFDESVPTQTNWLTSWLWSWDLLSSAITAFITSPC